MLFKTISGSLKVPYTDIFTENYFEPFEKPFNVGDKTKIFLDSESLTEVTIINTSVVEQVRMYELEFPDGSRDWFPLRTLKENKYN